MTYRIQVLDPAAFAHLVGLSDANLARHGAIRMAVDAKPSFPCRVTLDDGDPGETMLLVNHVSHDGNNPYRASHAIFVSESAPEAADYRDVVPPALDRRILSLRGFDAARMMAVATLVQPGEADPAIDHIDAHNATRGCFAARIERD